RKQVDHAVQTEAAARTKSHAIGSWLITASWTIHLNLALATAEKRLLDMQHRRFEHVDVRRKLGHRDRGLRDLSHAHHRLRIAGAFLDHHVAGIQNAARYAVIAAFERRHL